MAKGSTCFCRLFRLVVPQQRNHHSVFHIYWVATSAPYPTFRSPLCYLPRVAACGRLLPVIGREVTGRFRCRAVGRRRTDDRQVYAEGSGHRPDETPPAALIDPTRTVMVSHVTDSLTKQSGRWLPPNLAVPCASSVNPRDPHRPAVANFAHLQPLGGNGRPHLDRASLGSIYRVVLVYCLAA